MQCCRGAEASEACFATRGGASSETCMDCGFVVLTAAGGAALQAPFEDVKLGALLGRGSVGSVFSGTCADTPVAIKVFWAPAASTPFT